MLTPAELTVLGLVVERPTHGYDLERVIEQRGIRQWTDVGFSSIYYLLAKLEKRGLVRATSGGPGPKARRVFEVTDEGRRVAREEARALIADLRPAHHPVLVGIANLGLLSREEYRVAIRQRLAEVESRIEGVRAAQAAQEPLPHAAREVFSYSLGLLEAERTWLAARAREGGR